MQTYEESPAALVGSRAQHTQAQGAGGDGSQLLPGQGASMASFAVRLMSLNPYELSCLTSDNELMRHLNETQLLMESRLQDLHANKLAAALSSTATQQTPTPTNELGTNNNNNSFSQNARRDKYFLHLLQQQQQQQQQHHTNHLIHQQQQQSATSVPFNLRNNHIMTPPSPHHQQQQLLQSNQLLLSPISHYDNYYARQLATFAQQQPPMDQLQVQHHQQQQALLLAATAAAAQHHHHHQQQQQQQHDHQNHLNNQLQAIIAASQHQQQHLHNNNNNIITTTSSLLNSSSMSNGFHQNSQPIQTSNNNNQNPCLPAVNSLQQQLQLFKQQSLVQPALDLRTTPTRPISALSASSSPLGRACSTGSGQSTASTSGGARQHPKKIKLSEYRKMQQVTERASVASSSRTIANNPQDNMANSSDGNQQSPRQNASAPAPMAAPSSSSKIKSNCDNLNPCDNNKFDDQNRRQSDDVPNGKLSSSSNMQGTNNNPKSKQCNASCSLEQLNNNNDNNKNDTTTARASRLSTATAPVTITTTTSGKKYKGEFDEPTPADVTRRERELDRPEHYHRQALEKGECACVLGSEFRDRTSSEVLLMIEQWRSMDVEQRTKWKWDVNDLPKDIPLSHIKKFEDLRREFSDGRADFGGASKRKPLGIRGTRQFLLILYCLWGHPGRDDPMQRDGYCPHCFAKIKKANEQSTLVRVVNHFNMKHKIGANPRLSPQLESSASSTQSTSINDELKQQQQQHTIAQKRAHDDVDGAINQQQQLPPSSSTPSEFSLPPSPASTNCSGLVRETLLSVIEAAISKLDSPKSIVPADDCSEDPSKTRAPPNEDVKVVDKCVKN